MKGLDSPLGSKECGCLWCLSSSYYQCRCWTVKIPWNLYPPDKLWHNLHLPSKTAIVGSRIVTHTMTKQHETCDPLLTTKKHCFQCVPWRWHLCTRKTKRNQIDAVAKALLVVKNAFSNSQTYGLQLKDLMETINHQPTARIIRILRKFLST